MNRINTITIPDPDLLRLIATLIGCLVALLLAGVVGCKCPPAELADERTPTSAVECYDQAFEVVRDCREGFSPGHRSATEQACLGVLDRALKLCDRHYGQPYHNGNRGGRGDDTDTAAGDAL